MSIDLYLQVKKTERLDDLSNISKLVNAIVGIYI